jgi:hypothetical protein
MGVSLSVFKIGEYNKKAFIGEGKISTLNGQLTFKDLELLDELGSAKSTLKLKNYDKDNGRATYDVVHFSETIKNPVRVFLPNYEDYEEMAEGEICPENEAELKKKGRSEILNQGYQEVFNFEVIIDFKTEEIFVFTKKNVALSFMRRLRHKKVLEFGIITFDLSKIDEIQELGDVWGVWEDSTGRCKKKAYFGTQVHKVDGVDKPSITSYNVTYEHEEGNIGLIICKDCRISSNTSTVANSDLFKIYQNLKRELKKEVIKTSQQED